MSLAAQSYKIRIAARLRPRLQNEPEDDGIGVVRNEATGSSCISVANQRSQVFTFPFSSCYDKNSTQEEIFETDVKPLLDVLNSGVTVTIFAYGVTSSGKTFTMAGSPSQPGIIPRVMKELLNRQKPQSDHETLSFSMSYMEIYKDEVYDLLGDRENAPKLPVRENEAGKVFVAKLSTVPIATEQEFQTIYTRASKSRSVGSTNLNSESSRSHAILTVSMTIVDEERQKTLTGKLVLVDLAGSENNKLTGNDSTRMAESAAINKSLSVLGQVVHSLNKGASRIPYRDSKLTRILQDALGGSSIGLLIINLAPCAKFRQDTLNTLNFAARTKSVENKPVVNERDNRPAPKPHFAAVQQQAPRLAPAVLPSSIVDEQAGPSRSMPMEQMAATRSMKIVPRPSLAPVASVNTAGPSRRRGRASMIPVPGGLAPYVPPKEQLLRNGLFPMSEEMSEQIAMIVKMEVAKELERQEKERLFKESDSRRVFQEQTIREEEEEEDEVEKSMRLEEEEPQNSDVAPGADSEQITVSKGMLEHLLQHHQTLDTELMSGLADLEEKFQFDNRDGFLESVLSPISKKKAGRSYVHLARTMSDRGHMDISLELYRKAQSYVPDNAKLRDRIIEMEYAVKNKKAFVHSPKRSKKPSSKSKKKSKGKQKESFSLAVVCEEDAEMDVDENEADLLPVSQGDDSSTSSRTSGKRKRPFGQEVINSPKKRKGKRGTKNKDEGSEIQTPRRSERNQTKVEYVEVDQDDGEEWVSSPPRKVRGKRKLMS